MKFKYTYYILIVVASLLTACKSNTPKADAYGNFEADEVIISAESNGKLLAFTINEGEKVKNNQKVGLVDTILPALQMIEIEAQRKKINASINNIDAQIEIVKQQKENLTVDLERIQNLKQTGAATQKQLDDVNGQLKVMDKQIIAHGAQKAAITKELNILNAKQSLVKEQLNKCTIRNPIAGTVIEKYAEAGEVTAAGKPLYKIANLDTIILRAYVTGGRIQDIKIGQKCKVRIDKGETEYLDYEGTITWISSQTEFTPKIIQTKEERVNMVYAFKIEVCNNGKIKMGMPGEVVF